jgi:hypothetical protein
MNRQVVSMNRQLVTLLTVACLCIAGCSQTTEPEEDAAEGLNISLPGVEVKVNKKDGLKVTAPNTDVKVNKEGIDVKAPGTDVRVNEGGVDVKAPGTDISSSRSE